MHGLRSGFRIMTMAVLAGIVVTLTYAAGFSAGANSALLEHGMPGSGQIHVAGPGAAWIKPGDRPASPQDEFGIFWDVWNLLEKEFYGDMPSVQRRMYGAIQGMVATLKDPHTVFLDPKTAAIVKSDDKGSFEGIGAAIQYDPKSLRPRIAHVYKGTPAEKAGLRHGDIILEVDDSSTENLTLLEVITLIRGPKDTTTVLSILREGEQTPLDVPVVRQPIQIPVTESRLLDDNIAYLKLTDFNNVATTKVQDELAALLARQPRGLVFDLRGNPGGYLHVAVDIGSQFMSQGVILTEKSRDGSEQTFNVKPGGLATDKALPLVVLVDGGTASAAEIVSAAIRDSGRGILIGEKTYGKTSVQAPHGMSDGSELRVTVARWFTPKGDQIKDGLTPDIVVEMPADAVEADQDPQLERAQQYLLTGK
jgi:carboxyl-terminal processing protease